MSTIETRARSTSKKSSISWGRVLAAAILSELAVISILIIASGVYSFIVPPERKLAAQDIGELVGYYVAPPAGAAEEETVVITHVKFVSIPTRNQDDALAFYTEKLGFKLITDQPHGDNQRWIELRIGS